MPPAHRSRALVLVLLAGLAGSQVLGLAVALVTATRPRVTDFGLIGPGLGGHAQLVRIRALGGLPVDSVAGPGSEAGLRPGDVVTHIDGERTAEHPSGWYRGRFTVPPGTPLHLVVQREGRSFVTVLRTRRLEGPLRWQVGPPGSQTPEMDYRLFHWWTWGPQLLMSFLMFGVGLTLGVLRRKDRVAWTWARVFLGVSLATTISPGTPLLHVWPPWVALLWNLGTMVGTSYSMPLALQGLAEFPTPTRLSRHYWPWRWVTFALFALVGTAGAASMVAGHFAAWPAPTLERVHRIADLSFNAVLGLGFMGMTALLVAHKFEPPAGGASGRLRLLWHGAMGAALGGLWAVLVPERLWFGLAAPLGAAGGWLGVFLDGVAPVLLVCLLPLSFAYAILARRLFGIRFVIRRGLQHLLLSRGMLAVEGVVLFLILEQSMRRGAAVPGVPGPALAAVVALLVVSALALVNRPLMQGLDRRFFRDRYDARRVMLGLGQELARLRERDEILRRIGEAILAALHPARVGIFRRAEDGAGLRAGWQSSPARERGKDVPIAPAEVEREAASLSERLSAADEGRAWLPIDPPPGDDARRWVEPGVDAKDEAEARAVAPYELCVPLRQSRRISGCIALAAKLSEEPFTAEDRELLVTVAHQAALALENADLLAVARREAQLAREVEIARQVQENLFPRELPEVPGWEVAAVCRPARVVAGDYYDVVRSADGGLGVALGDVSGKGIGASLLSAGVHAMVRSRLPGGSCDLAGLLVDLNTHLLASSAPDMFATLVVARIEPAEGRVVYVNAGHPPPLLLTAGGARWLDAGGPLVGVLPEARYVTGEAKMAPGDLLAIYSDGVTEAERPGGEMFGEDRLLAAMMHARGSRAAATLEALLDAVQEFAGAGEPADDLSFIVVRRQP